MCSFGCCGVRIYIVSQYAVSRCTVSQSLRCHECSRICSFHSFLVSRCAFAVSRFVIRRVCVGKVFKFVQFGEVSLSLRYPDLQFQFAVFVGAVSQSLGNNMRKKEISQKPVTDTWETVFVANWKICKEHGSNKGNMKCHSSPEAMGFRVGGLSCWVGLDQAKKFTKC